MKDERERVNIRGKGTSLGDTPTELLKSQNRYIVLSKLNVLIISR